MKMTSALPRLAGATVLSLLAIALAAIALPASSLAAPLPEGSDPVLTIAPSPALVPTTTVGNQSPTVEFELRNDGAEQAAIDKVMLEGGDAGEFSFSGSNCGTLQPGEHCSAWIALKPSSAGAKTATLHVTFAGGRPEQAFEISGLSAPAHFSFQPGSHDFGLQPIHSEAQRVTFQIENDGAAAAAVGWLGFSGDSNGFWFGNSDCWGRTLAPGESCSLEVYFAPNDARPYSTQLQLDSSGTGFTAALSGEGGRPNVEAAPNPADFGTATVGSASATQTIVVSNSGNVAASFFIGIVAGGDSGSFQLLDETCSAAALMPAASCTARVRFRPLDAGAKTARLAFFGDSEGGAMVTLRGEGVDPVATLTPSAFDFGSQAAGGKSAGHAFALRNEGTAPLELTSVAIAGADLDQFVVSGDECSDATLAPGAECLVRVRFAPDGIGPKLAKLRVRGVTGAFVAALAGTGVAGPGGDGEQAAASDWSATLGAGPAPRPGRHRAHRRFSRGSAVDSPPSRMARKAAVRPRVVSRGRAQ